MTLAITGVTGFVGGAVARALVAGGASLRLLARNVAKAPALPGSVVVPCAYADRAQAEQALAGVETLFMVSAAESVDRIAEHRAFVDAAKAAGVRHVVYTSFVSAAPDALFTLARDHFATEEHIKASGLGYTFLRDNLYLDFMPKLVDDDGLISGPAGEGRVAGVARADVARAAVAVLREPASHAGVTYDLTGPEALTMTEIARRLASARGKPVTFHDETIAEAYAARARFGAPAWQVDAWVSTYTAIASGALATVTNDVKRLTGKPPLSLTLVLVP